MYLVLGAENSKIHKILLCLMLINMINFPSNTTFSFQIFTRLKVILLILLSCFVDFMSSHGFVIFNLNIFELLLQHLVFPRIHILNLMLSQCMWNCEGIFFTRQISK